MERKNGKTKYLNETHKSKNIQPNGNNNKNETGERIYFFCKKQYN